MLTSFILWFVKKKKKQPNLETPESILKQIIQMYTSSDVEQMPTSYFLNENFPFTED